MATAGATSAAKHALTEDVLDHLLARGRLDESLRTTARAVGATHSLLLYHFGSRDELLTAVQLACERRERAHLTTLQLTTTDPREVMQAMWIHLADERMWPVYRLAFSLGVRGRGREHAADRAAWIAALEPIVRALGIPADAAPDEAELWLATCRGLLWELVTGADPAAVERAAQRLFRHYTG